LELTITCPSSLPRVEVDADLVRQVVINLLSNAIKYSPPRGAITIEAVEDAATVRVSVSDRGPGIPADQMRRIFGQFYRLAGAESEAEGAGLGLAIVKNIIQLHQGHIDVQNRAGGGAAFSFHLPKEPQGRAAAAALLGDRILQPGFQQILRLSVRMIAEMMETRTVALLLLDEGEGELRVQAALGLAAEQAARPVLSRSAGLAGRVLEAGKPGLQQPADEPPVFAGRGYEAQQTGAAAAAPLHVRGRRIGVILVAGKVNAAPLDEDDLDLLETLSETVSAALTRADAHVDQTHRLMQIGEALQALVMMKHSNIPTATPLALRLLAKTAQALGLSGAEVKRLQYVASLHDAGMVRVGQDILHKVGVLSDGERDEVDRHPEDGASLLEPLLLVPEMEQIILAHHERIDGAGYPAGRRAEDIPLAARILAVVDTFFAMIVARPYREGKHPVAVAQELRSHAGTQFDPHVVEAFLNVLQQEGMLGSAPAEASGPASPGYPVPPQEKRWQPQES
jgi:HD-GYP domain-containing protein (c-di-GMP phosphodiesterase class II)